MSHCEGCATLPAGLALCHVCGQAKPRESGFYQDRRGGWGSYYPQCRDCRRTAAKAWSKAHYIPKGQR